MASGTAAASTSSAPATRPQSTSPATDVSAAAYYNNDLDPDTATTLFVRDTAADQIAIQSPADAGSLAATGKLRVDVNRDAVFDIHYTADGAASNGRGLAALQVDGTYGLYQVDLLKGCRNRTPRAADGAAAQWVRPACGGQ